jgi:dUTP pyrophosphatase
MKTISVKRMHPEATLPTRAHPEDAGMDLYALEDTELPPFDGKLARTGVAFAIAQGHVGMIADRSSMAKKGVKVSGGIIDSGYRGEVLVVLRNLTAQEIVLKRGERIAQMLTLPIVTPALVEAQDLDSTARGAGGFGSTGA